MLTRPMVGQMWGTVTDSIVLKLSMTVGSYRLNVAAEHHCMFCSEVFMTRLSMTLLLYWHFILIGGEQVECHVQWSHCYSSASSPFKPCFTLFNSSDSERNWKLWWRVLLHATLPTPVLCSDESVTRQNEYIGEWIYISALRMTMFHFYVHLLFWLSW